MAHFAEIDNNNIVLRVLVVPNEQEHRGQEYLADELGIGSRWIQCSYNNNIRKQYPGIDYYFDEANDVFISPKPYSSWTLNENFDWKAPIPYPIDNSNKYYWDEDNLSWNIIKNDNNST